MLLEPMVAPHVTAESETEEPAAGYLLRSSTMAPVRRPPNPGRGHTDMVFISDLDVLSARKVMDASKSFTAEW